MHLTSPSVLCSSAHCSSPVSRSKQQRVRQAPASPAARSAKCKAKVFKVAAAIWAKHFGRMRVRHRKRCDAGLPRGPRDKQAGKELRRGPRRAPKRAKPTPRVAQAPRKESAENNGLEGPDHKPGGSHTMLGQGAQIRQTSYQSAPLEALGDILTIPDYSVTSWVVWGPT